MPSLDSITNVSTVSDVTQSSTISLNSIGSVASVGNIAYLANQIYDIGSVSNDSSVGDIRRLGVIGFDSVKNTSKVSSFLASYNEYIEIPSTVNQSTIGQIQVYVAPVPLDTFTPITRPVKTISAQVTGLRKFVFRDIAIRGGSHPLTGDILSVTDSSAVGQAIKNIVLTNKTERFFDDIDFGVGIESYLFDLYSSDLQSRIEESIISQVSTHEPRAIILGVSVNQIPAKNQLGIAIKYKIRTTSVVDTVTLTLERR
jgi:phage baseplate assembly protein W